MRLAVWLLFAFAAMTSSAENSDPHLWLEDIGGERALTWVRAQNAVAEKEFAADPRFEPLRQDLLRILNSRERIPYVQRIGDRYYNFWRDELNPRGLWRRTTLDEYRKPQPAWENLLDLDALAKADNENWVWHGADCLRPEKDGEPYRRCVLSLSRGGADAVVLREFDLIDKAFVQDGFALPEAKQDFAWKDFNTAWIASDFGPGSMTSSGYPRIVKEWKRGTPIDQARIVYEGHTSDVSVGAYSERDSGKRRDWIVRSVTFWTSEHFVLNDDQPIKLDVPADASVDTFQELLLVKTRTPWMVADNTYPSGALLSIDFDQFMRGARNFELLYMPTARSSLASYAKTRNAVLLSELDNVRARLWELQRHDRSWRRRRVALPDNAQVNVAGTYWASDDYFLTRQDFATPTTLLQKTAGSTPLQAFKTLPPFFNAAGLQTTQFEATSKDGSKIPYFLVKRSNTELNGTQPTLLYGYGGFEQTQQPWYSGVFGKGWLEQGGVFVLANLRGGGEFGPAWHQAAQQENKQRTWDDMAAVAQDLIGRQVTSPKHLGIMGGSQGGLLVTTALVQRPELFGAVVAQVPLIDMLRYHKLLAGASWMAEYGDPDDPQQRAFIEKYSPYQNVRKDAKYPRLFLTTSTRDDRVHPGHARKMAARMQAMGHNVLYFENIEGGHGGAANNEQAARMWAQTFSFLWRSLK